MPHAAPKVASVDGVKTSRPGQVHASKASHPGRVRIVVGHADVVGAVEEILQRVRSRVAVRRQVSAPVPAGIPIGAANASHIEARDHAQAGIRSARGSTELSSHVVEANPSARPVD